MPKSTYLPRNSDFSSDNEKNQSTQIIIYFTTDYAKRKAQRRTELESLYILQKMSAAGKTNHTKVSIPMNCNNNCFVIM